MRSAKPGRQHQIQRTQAHLQHGHRTDLWFPHHGQVWGETLCLPAFHRRVEMHAYTLLHDPTPADQGAYRPGARFGAHEILHMLNHNPGSLPTGAILEYRGQRYQVQDKFDHHTGRRVQRLIQLHD